MKNLILLKNLTPGAAKILFVLMLSTNALASEYLAGPSSTEGIPQTGDLPTIDSTTDSAYSTTTLIQKTIQQARELPMGQRILFYQNAVDRIVKKSGPIPTEQIVRFILNRSVDVMSAALPVAGNNPDLVAQWAANFYEENFVLALAFANNPRCFEGTPVPDVGTILKTISFAEFGRIYSTLMFKFSSNLVSRSAKGLMLIKSIDYLQWDLNQDLRRRENGIRESIYDLQVIKTELIAYRNLQLKLSLKEEPEQADLAQTRRQFYDVLTSLPARLKQSGVVSTIGGY